MSFNIGIFATAIICLWPHLSYGEDCDSMELPSIGEAIVKAAAQRATGRIFDSESASAKQLGTAILIDATAGLALTAKHVVRVRTSGSGPIQYFVEFPSLLPNNRIAAHSISEINHSSSELPITDVARDISVLKLDRIPPLALMGDISPRPVSMRAEHVYGGYPLQSPQILTGTSIPSRMGGCTFNFETTTSRGDSGGPIYDARGLLVGVTIQSEASESQGRFVPLGCFAEDLAVIKPYGEDPSDKLIRLLRGVPPGFIPPSFFPPISANSDYVYNLDLMRFVETVSEARRIDPALLPYAACPIGQAIFERLSPYYWEKYFNISELQTAEADVGDQSNSTRGGGGAAGTNVNGRSDGQAGPESGPSSSPTQAGDGGFDASSWSAKETFGYASRLLDALGNASKKMTQEKADYTLPYIVSVVRSAEAKVESGLDNEDLASVRLDTLSKLASVSGDLARELSVPTYAEISRQYSAIVASIEGGPEGPSGSGSDVTSSTNFPILAANLELAVDNRLTAAQWSDLLAPWEKGTASDITIIDGAPGDGLSSILLKHAAGTEAGDVYLLDSTSTTTLSNGLVDLSKELPDAAEGLLPQAVEAQVIDGRLVSLPVAAYAPALYYRSDLLEKYGEKIPATWDELSATALKIMEGEGNGNTWGYVWQGARNNGLTSNAVEWIKSNGGGNVVDPDGSVTVNNDRAIEALEMAQGWIGSITPMDVVNFGNEEVRNFWQSGNAVFMRNWPYAYNLASSEESPVRDLFGIAPLPAAIGGSDSSATLGVVSVAVSERTDNMEASLSLAKYIASAEFQSRFSIAANALPTNVALYEDSDLADRQPIVPLWKEIVLGSAPLFAVSRDYPREEVSDAVATAAYATLVGEGSAEERIHDLADELQKLMGGF